MIDLKENNIIVTGATGGIGNSIIEKLYNAGANILATGTKNEKLEELKKKFKGIKPTDYQSKMKQKQFLFNRGFSTQIIERIL